MLLTLHSFGLKLCSATFDLKHSALHCTVHSKLYRVYSTQLSVQCSALCTPSVYKSYLHKAEILELKLDTS